MVQGEPGASLLDRPSRNHLISAIQRYMDESIMAFAFDEELSQIRAATKDPTVHVVVGWLWFHYDDIQDHRAGLSKVEWDYFQRLILLLESDGQIEHVAKRTWSVRQVVAGLALLGFGLCVAWLGVGWHLFGAALAFGPVSILLAYWKGRASARRNQEQIGLAPFASFAELRAVRKAVSGFAKRRYPGQTTTRTVHSRLLTMAVWLQTWVLWSFVAPLVLLFQTFPEKETTTRVRVAANG